LADRRTHFKNRARGGDKFHQGQHDWEVKMGRV